MAGDQSGQFLPLILSKLEAASSVLPRIETLVRYPCVVHLAAPWALSSGNALEFLCSVEPRTQLLANLAQPLLQRKLLEKRSYLSRPRSCLWWHIRREMSTSIACQVFFQLLTANWIIELDSPIVLLITILKWRFECAGKPRFLQESLGAGKGRRLQQLVLPVLSH